MIILRAFVALVAGFLSMAIVVGVLTALHTRLAPAWVGATGHPRPAYVVINLLFSFAAAMLGGYVTAWIAKSNPVIHVLLLALVVLLLGALSTIQQRGMQPIWYQLLLLVVAPAGVFAGGMLRLRMLGI